jgi:hypothetical protein
MKINPKLRQDLIKYNLNYPTDARTKEYKSEVAKYRGVPELYKLALQTKVATAKIIQRDIDRKEKKEANKKARAEAKILKKNLKHYIGSITLKLQITYKKKYSNIVFRTISVDIKSTNMKADLDDIVNEYIQGVEDESPVDKVELLNRTDNIKEVNNKLKPLNKIRMKQAGVGIYDGYDKQEWSTNTGRCVFDWIIHKYGDIKGFKKVCNYESLCNIFYDIDDDEEYGEDEDDEWIIIYNPLDLLNVGVNTNNIKRFCERFNLPMYAVDENDNTFTQFIPKSPNKLAPSFMYRLSNTHIYPITDTNKIKSIVKITSMINNMSSDMIETYKPKKEEDGTDDIKDKLENVVFVENIGDKLLEMINNNKIPEKLNLKDKQLVSFYIGKIKYISNKDIDIIKELCSNMKIEYKGQGVGTLLIDIIKEAIGKDKLPKSTFNPYVSKTLNVAVKARARIGIIDDDYHKPSLVGQSQKGHKKYAKSDLMAWDINKCYSACMNNPSEDWIRLDFNDTWEDYDGGLKLGIYYLKTEDTTLFKKSGYYSTCIIKKAISEGIDFVITKQLIASHTEDKTILTKIIDVIMKYSNGNTAISKTVINLMSGMLGQASAKISKNIKINNDIEQIFNFLNKYCELADGLMMNKIQDTPYYMYGFNKEVILNENNRPMYIQVLDESNIRLYEMAKAMGGNVVAYKVDCAVVAGGNKETKCDSEWGGYSSCDIPNITRKEIINDVDFICDRDWNDNKYLKLNDSDKWEDIYNLLMRNKGLLLQASAGNGKTYTAKMIASKLGDRVKIIAPTNKAALNIGGSTIHRFLEMNKDGYIKPKKIKFIDDNYDVIIIDEISMIPKELWRRLCLLKQELPHIIFLLLGDEKQIPPVEEETIQDYFNHPAVKYLSNYNKNILNVRKRYDETLYNLLEDVDNININDKVAYPPLETTRNICYYNKTRIRVNKMWNNKKKKAGDLFIPKYNNENDEHAKQSQDMYIYNGLPLIAMKTKWDEGMLFANSETFEVCDIGDDYISMFNERPDENGAKELYVYNCPIEDLNKYFLMNYCSTTHKTQGETIVENFTIYDWDAMDTKLRYTALSRGKKVEQVYFN